jgi:hypothetical protein
MEQTEGAEAETKKKELIESWSSRICSHQLRGSRDHGEWKMSEMGWGGGEGEEGREG